MTIQQAIDTIKTFTKFNKKMFSGSKKGSEILEDYEELPAYLREYVEQVIPSKDVKFHLGGDPFQLVALKNLIDKKFDIACEYGVEGSSWVDEWLVIGQQFYDPFCVNLFSKEGTVFRFGVNRKKRALGEPIAVADSIGQFLLCAFAVDYALSDFKDALIFDNSKKSVEVRLADEPAQWLFPKMKEWAGKYFSEWCGEFKNAEA